MGAIAQPRYPHICDLAAKKNVMPDSAQLARLPLRVPLVKEVWGIWNGLSLARSNVLGIIPATMLSRFKVRPLPGRDPGPTMILTLRPAGSLWLMTEAV